MCIAMNRYQTATYGAQAVESLKGGVFAESSSLTPSDPQNPSEETMNITNTLTRFVETNTVALKEATVPTAPSIDSDDHLYRRISDEKSDLNPVLLEKQREISAYLYDVNPTAKRIINMTRDFVVGDGWELRSNNKLVQNVLDTFWKDPRNKWHVKLGDRVRDLGIFGEWCFSVTRQDNGNILLGWIDPSRIEQVVTYADPDTGINNDEVFTEIVLKQRLTDPKPRRLKIIRYDEKVGEVVGILPSDGDRYVGECFFFSINRMTRATRGRSDLFCVADWLDQHDKFLFNRAERSALANAWFVDVTLDGFNDDQVRDFAMKNGRPPKAGGMRFHNEKVSYDTVAPNMQASDASNEEKMLRTPIRTGAGLPEHWLFGSGEDANRASAYEMSDPPIRMMSMRQREVKNFINDMASFVVTLADSAGMLVGVKDEEKTFDVIAPEISKRDTQKASTTLQTATMSLVVAEQNGYISNESACRMFLFLAGELGYDGLDYESEKKKIDERDGEIFDDLDLDSDPTDPEQEQAETDPDAGEE